MIFNSVIVLFRIGHAGMTLTSGRFEARGMGKNAVAHQALVGLKDYLASELGEGLVGG